MATIQSQHVESVEVVEGIVSIVVREPSRPGRVGDGSTGSQLRYIDLTIQAFEKIADVVAHPGV